MGQPGNGPWMKRILLLAGVYNLAWGAFVVLFPTLPFDWLGLEHPRYIQIWQCVGMIVGVYGVGYAIASQSPLRHWPIVLVGLLGKILGPIGFVSAAMEGSLPWAAGWTILSNDLIWWVPFAVILRATMLDFVSESEQAFEARDRMMLKHMSQEGYSLFELSQIRPTLVVFLRHAGCTFCREALHDLSAQRRELEDGGVQLAFVTMSEEPGAQKIFDAYGLGDAPRISDPQCELYRAFDLRRGSWSEMFAPSVWWRGLKAGVFAGNGLGALDGDGFRMPGVFLIRDGRVLRSYRHTSPADRPKYLELASCEDCNPQPVELHHRLAS